MDEMIQNRKKLLLRGNGKITAFYDAPEGMVSSYQANFGTIKSSMNVARTSGKEYISSIMTVTPDPRTLNRNNTRIETMKEDLRQADKKLTQTNALLKKIANRAMEYNGDELHDKYAANLSKLKYLNAGNRFNGALRTPMQVRVQNLMVPSFH